MAERALHVSNLSHGYKGAPRWRDPYHCEWSIVIGDRVRRLRAERDLSLRELADAVGKPEGGRYSGASLSRLERGWASAPLYLYLGIAVALDVEPGRLLGPDDVQRPVTEGELTVLRTLRRLEIAPDEVLSRLVEPCQPGSGSPATRRQLG